MAKNTKIIKLTNGTYTYVPVTLADAVQYSYEGGAMSVQQAIGTLATSQISIAEHLHPQGTDLQTHSTSVTNNVGSIILSQNNSTVTIKNDGSTTPTSTYAYVGIIDDSNAGLKLKVSYTDTKPNDKAIKIGDNSGTATQAFTTNSSAERTLTIKGSTNNPIQTVVSGSANSVTLTVDHAKQGPSTTADTTVGQTSAVTIGVGDNKSFNVPTFTVNSYGHVTGASNTTVSVDLSGLTGAMHYKGNKTSLPTPLPGEYIVGDVISYNKAEYVLEYENSTYTWRELGDEGSHALKTVSITGTNGLTGGGTLSADRTISHADQSAASNEDSTKVLNASGGTAADSVDVITGIKRDAYGHVVGIVSGKTQNTHYESKNTVGAQNATSNSSKTNGNVYLNHIENGSSTSSHKITGASGVSVASDASGNITITGPGTKDNNYSQIAINAQATSTTTEAAGGTAVTLEPASSADKLSIESVNKWVQVKGTNGGANADKIQIAHDILWTGTPSTTQTLYKFTYDNAGHVTNLTAVSADKVIGSVTSNYKIVEGNAIDDLDADFLSLLGLSGNTGNDIATGNQTTNNYYHS